MDLYRRPIESDAGQTTAEYCSLIITCILILLNVDQNSVAIFGQADRKITLSILNQICLLDSQFTLLSFAHQLFQLEIFNF